MRHILLLTVLSAFSYTAAVANCLSQHEMDNPDHLYKLEDSDTDQIVEDLETGLIWTRCPLGQSVQSGICADDVTVNNTYTWGEALDAAQAANNAVYEDIDDWRLPNVKELQSIIAPTCKEQALNSFAFPTQQNTTLYSSTPDVTSANNVFIFKLSDGQIGVSGKLAMRSVYLVSEATP